MFPLPVAPRIPLIVATEDDPMLRGCLRELFGDEGYRVTFATAQSVTEVAALAPDLLLLDGRGQGSDSGWDFLERLVADPATAAIPVVMLTGESHAADIHGARMAELGVAMIAKPFDIEDVIEQCRARLTAAAANVPCGCGRR